MVQSNRTVLVVLRSTAECEQLVELMPTRPGFGGHYVFSTDKARAVIEQQASRKGAITHIVIEESAALSDGGSGSVSETLRFLGELNEDGYSPGDRPKITVLTERFHGDGRFAKKYPGCVTHRKVNVLSGSTPLDLS